MSLWRNSLIFLPHLQPWEELNKLLIFSSGYLKTFKLLVFQTGYKCMLDRQSDNINFAPNIEAFLRKNLKKVYYGDSKILRLFFRP